MADRQTRVSLSVQMQQYIDGMQKAAKATRETASEADKLAQKRQAFEQIGRGAVIAGTALTAASVLAVKAAVDWESAWAGVTKTVDGTPEQMAEVEQGLRDLTAVLPASHQEIAAVAEAAGQLGIQTDNVVEFTRTMIDLGETTNLSANEAATALARFSNIMGTAQSDVDRLGSSIVGLGNNYATTEAEIVEMSLRLAGAGRQIGLSEGEVLGLSTALSSVGIEAEAGGSAFSKVMIDIAASVDEGGERLEQFASVAGLGADEFAQKWRTAPSEALSLFVKGLANAESQGSSTLGVLAELGITEVRMRDALLRSAGAADMFTEAMERGNSEFDSNNALTAEAAKRYETFESKTAIMYNSINDLAIGIGEGLVPSLTAAVDGVTGFAQLMGDLPDPVQGLIGILGGAAGAVALVGGAGLLAVPKIAEFKVALQTLGTTAGRLAFIGGGVTVALTALIAVVGSVAIAQAQARQRAEDYASALKQGGDAAKELAIQNLAVEKTLLGANFGSAYDNAEKLGIGLDLAAEAAAGNKKALEELNAVLDVATGGGQAAQDMADELGISLIDLSQSAGTLREQVNEQNEALERGHEINRQSKDATDENTRSTRDAADVYVDAADAVGEMESKLQTLVETINEANGVGQDAVSSNIRYQETLAEVTAQIESGERGLDANTEAGRNNQQMLLQLAQDSQDAAKAQFDLDGNTKNYSKSLAEGRQKLIESAQAMGATEDEAKALADQIYKIPTQREIEIIADTSKASQALRSFVIGWDGTRINLNVEAQRDGAQSAGPGRAWGGPIVGPGTSTSDSIMTPLSNGEHVWTAAEVNAAGGHAAVESMRRWVKSGTGFPMFAGTTTATGHSGPYVVVENLYARDEQEAAAAIETRWRRAMVNA